MLKFLLALSVLACPTAAQSTQSNRATPAQSDAGLDELYRQLESTDRMTPAVRVFQAVGPAVVFIETEYTQSGRHVLWGAWERSYGGSGSGVVVHPNGYVVTNYHVVKKAEKITVAFDQNPTRYEATLVSYVEKEDLALLKIQADQEFHAVRMGTSSDLMPGERVVAIGNPYGQTHTVSTGIISGLHRGVQIPDHGLAFSDLIQTDASINFGNSGGPLLNIRGELIGINTAMNSQAENIGFAIPVDRLRIVLTDILYPQARDSWLGFEVGQDDQLIVQKVWSDSPAAAAGICEGDKVVALGQAYVKTHDEFLHASLALEPRQDVQVAYTRDGEVFRARVNSWDRFDGLLFERLGMTVSELEIEGRTWVFVDRVSENSPAQAIGLESDDLIPSIRLPQKRPSNWRINNKHSLALLVQDLAPGAVIHLDVLRDDDGNKSYHPTDEFYRGKLTIR